MPRTLLAMLFALPVLPAGACDPAEMNAHLTAVCRTALDPAIGWVRAATPAGERAAIAAAIERADAACDSGDPAVGAREAVRLARLAGRLEARVAGE